MGLIAKRKIKILVVEDSAVVRLLLVHILNADADFQVIGTANNGREALEFVACNAPDIILMDIHMPEMDGFEATRRIMETRPIPIVICSAATRGDATVSFRLMEAGALACVEKPVGGEHPNYDKTAAQLRQTVKLMSEVKLVRRWPLRKAAVTPVPSVKRASQKIEVIGIGASTGGPPVLQTILSGLPGDFPVPILIVQHIAPGFLGGLAEWLSQTTELHVEIAVHGQTAEAGHVYLAPDDCHLTMRSVGKMALSRDGAQRGLRPSVGELFRSLSDVYGPSALGILLTGMGKDGAPELKQMKSRGAVTIAQDRATSVVHGMAGEAIALDAATHILPADRIADTLTMEVARTAAIPRDA